MQPVGGWTERADFTSGLYRGSITWLDNSGDRWIAAGSATALKVSTLGGVVSDITPVGLSSGLVSAGLSTGYGAGTYGVGAYSTPRISSTITEATAWSLDTWGEYLVACNPADGNLYEWQLSTGTPAAIIANAPTSCLGLHVTEERFVFALGAGGDPRRIEWCDRENNTVWTAAATNEAGGQTLETDGQIMRGIPVAGESLILTENDAHAATYQGPPFVYGFRRVGNNCGPISRMAATPVEGGAMWMGEGSFYAYLGGVVEEVQSDVADYVFNNVNTAQKSKTWAVYNGRFDEVWFFYPSEQSTEVDSYVAYSRRERHWQIGSLVRTTGVDAGVTTLPVWFGGDAKAYDHETGVADNAFAETGPVSFAEDSSVVTLNSMIPDERTQGDVNTTIKTRLYPNAAETSHGPYASGNPTDVRATGRQARFLVEGGSADWRWGVPRFEVRARGRR